MNRWGISPEKHKTWHGGNKLIITRKRKLTPKTHRRGGGGGNGRHRTLIDIYNSAAASFLQLTSKALVRTNVHIYAANMWMWMCAVHTCSCSLWCHPQHRTSCVVSFSGGRWGGSCDIFYKFDYCLFIYYSFLFLFCFNSIFAWIYIWVTEIF